MDFTEKISGALILTAVLKFLQTIALDFPYIRLQFFPGKYFRHQGEKFLQTNVLKISKNGSTSRVHLTSSNVFSSLVES